MHRFMQVTGHDDYASLYAWSIDDSPAFWEALCEFCDVRFDSAAQTTLARPGQHHGRRLVQPAVS